MTAQVLPLLLVLADQVPEEEDVVAGWTAFAVFIALAVAVAVLGFSLTKRLRNVARAEGEGRYAPSDRRRPTTIAEANEAASDGRDPSGDGPDGTGDDLR